MHENLRGKRGICLSLLFNYKGTIKRNILHIISILYNAGYPIDTGVAPSDPLLQYD